MIAAAVIDEIRRLLSEEELSQRAIALRVGVSRGTVGAVARRTRPDYRPPPGQWDADYVEPGGLPTRCPGCGGMVLMPCLACRVRALRRVGRAGPAEKTRMNAVATSTLRSP